MMPFMLAAFLTNAAIANVASRFRYKSRFFEISEVIAYEEIFERSKSKTLGISERAGSSGSVVTNAITVEMEAPFLAIVYCQWGINFYAKQSQQNINEKPHDYITTLQGSPNSISRTQAELKVFEVLLRSIKEIGPSKERDQYGFVMGFHPFIRMPDLHSYVRPIPTSATYVLRLIVESCKSWYLQPREGHTVLSCRLNTLKFAQKVYKSVNSFRLSEPYEPRPGCFCSDCCNPGLMEHLRILENDLFKLISEKRWDLYHQSPIVAGFQMARILARATQLGTRFCSISQYVGVVLHLYNLLRQFDLLDEEPELLEPLCDAIGHNIFRAPRPTDGFFSKYAAFQSMAYKFDKRTKTYTFEESNGNDRQIHLHPHSLSVMTGLNDCGFKPFCNRWGPVWRGNDKRSRVNNNGVEKMAHQIAAHPLICVLEPLETIVCPEWEGNFPVARIDWFKVFTACTDILEKISAVHCSDPRDLTSTHIHRNRDASFACGKSDVEFLLGMAQQLDRPSFKVECATYISVAGNAIRETLKGKTGFMVNF